MEEGNVDGDDTGDSDGYKDDTDLTITMPLNSQLRIRYFNQVPRAEEAEGGSAAAKQISRVDDVDNALVLWRISRP